jgi:phosphate transport system substrate-binding protein
VRDILRYLAAATVCLAAACVGCGPTNDAANAGAAKRLRGGGSTFINPLFDERWIGDYAAKGVEIDYTGKGSGAGITSMIDGTADFGCTDAIMSADEIKQAGGEDAVLHIPLVMGAVVPIYNLEGVKDLTFNAEILSGVYRGKITKWDDARIKAANPDAKLPPEKINVVFRADGSGTSFIFTSYLTAADKDWADKDHGGPGQTKQLRVDGGQGMSGNPAVVEAVKSTKGAIGYTELIYALKNPGLSVGKVLSRDGEPLVGSLEGVTAAAENGSKRFTPDENNSLRFSIVYEPGKGSYPISGTTWAVVKVKQPADRAKALKGFFHWAVHDGQSSAAELKYAPLPAAVVERADKKIDRIGEQ